MLKLQKNGVYNLWRNIFPTTAYERKNNAAYKSRAEGITVVVYKGAKPNDLDSEFASPSARASDALLVYRASVAPNQEVPSQYTAYQSYSTIQLLRQMFGSVQVQLKDGAETARALRSGQAIWWAMWTQTAFSDPSDYPLLSWDSTEAFRGAVLTGDVTTVVDGTGEIQYDDTSIIENVEYVLQPINLMMDHWLSKAGLQGYTQLSSCSKYASHLSYSAPSLGVALLEDGTPVTWGEALTRDASNNEVYVDINGNDLVAFDPPPQTPFTQVAQGYNYSIGIKADGTLSLWGFYTVDATPPSQYTQTPSGTFSKVVAATTTTTQEERFAGIKTTGEIVCWNYRGGAQGTPAGSDFVDIAFLTYLGDIVAALKSDGTLVVWSSKGATSALIDNAPTFMTFSGLCQTVGSSAPAGAITTSGEIILWGGNTSSAVYKDAPTDSGHKKVVLADTIGVSIKEDGTVVSWGPSNVDAYVSTIPERIVDVSIADPFGSAYFVLLLGESGRIYPVTEQQGIPDLALA